MKTITIKQPWASLICEGVKDIENRTWQTNFRGRVLVHAGADNLLKKCEFIDDLLSVEQIIDTSNNNKETEIFGSKLYTGAIIGSVEIVDCVINHQSIWAEKTQIPYLADVLEDIKLIGKPIKPKIIYNWVLANPIIFTEPIPVKGKLSFWDYPNILAEPEEKDGELFCHCQLTVKEISQVTGDSRFGYYCRYCGGKWYK